MSDICVIFGVCWWSILVFSFLIFKIVNKNIFLNAYQFNTFENHDSTMIVSHTFNTQTSTVQFLQLNENDKVAFVNVVAVLSVQSLSIRSKYQITISENNIGEKPTTKSDNEQLYVEMLKRYTSCMKTHQATKTKMK